MQCCRNHRPSVASAAAAAVVAALAFVAAPDVRAFDMMRITCRGFYAASLADRGSIIMWLRGFHAGKSGIVRATDAAEMRVYGEKLAHYCGEHPKANVIDASEHILAEQ